MLKSSALAQRANKASRKGFFRTLSIASVVVLLESSAYAMGSGGEGGEGGGGMLGMLPLLVIVAIMYFLLIRPQQKRQKDVKQMQSSLRVGDRVTTTGGMHGTIATISETTVSLKIAEKVKIEVDRSAITGIRSPSTDSSK